MQAHQVRVVGTNTLRRARNAEAFLAAAEAALGHPVEVISGIEEARLIYLGVSHYTDTTEGSNLVLDIGGGSTELIIGEGYEPKYLESLSIGCVGLSREHFEGRQDQSEALRPRAARGRASSCDPSPRRFAAAAGIERSGRRAPCAPRATSCIELGLVETRRHARGSRDGDRDHGRSQARRRSRAPRARRRARTRIRGRNGDSFGGHEHAEDRQARDQQRRAARRFAVRHARPVASPRRA